MHFDSDDLDSQAEVERVAPTKMDGVELSMDALGQLKDGDEAQQKLAPFGSQYRAWIDSQKAKVPKSPKKRRETAEELLKRAKVAAGRIEQALRCSETSSAWKHFASPTGHGAGSQAAARRLEGKDPTTITPAWRPFQLAFLLMNLPSVADPSTRIAKLWICCSSPPVAARPRPTWAWQRSPSFFGACGIRV